jgi:hypothetical protein
VHSLTATMTAKHRGHLRLGMDDHGLPIPIAELGQPLVDRLGRQPRGLQNRLRALLIQALAVWRMAVRRFLARPYAMPF